MFFYDMNLRGNCSLYEYLYRCIRHDIAHGTIAPGEKLPSKRNLAKHLGVSLITVEAAYQQLAAEGYIRSRERCGYYASDLAPAERVQQKSNERLGTTHLGEESGASGGLQEANDRGNAHDTGRSNARIGAQAPRSRPRATDGAEAADAALDAAPSLLADFTHSTLATELFPYATWAKAVRKTLSDESAATLAEASSAAGSPQLRQAIADHLREYRGMHVLSLIHI